MDRTDFFYDLTPFVVMEAMEEAQLAPDGSCLQLNSLENRVYDLGLEDGSHVVAKFYRPNRWSRQQIREEHEFLFKLKREEIPVCAPLVLPGGESIGETRGIYYAIWPRTGGRQTDEFTPSQLESLGRYLGRIHSSGHSLKHRPRLDLYRMVEKPLEIITQLPLPSSLLQRYASAARRWGDIYGELLDGVPFIAIHGDCHTGNLLMKGDSFFFLDFDDCLTGPAVQDIWMLLGGDDYSRPLDHLLKGYRTFRDFKDKWLNLIEPLRALRMIYYASWITLRRQDPAFQHAFPHFGTREYWEQEICDLEKQGDRCSAFSGITFSEEETVPEEELTNADFFYDWEE